MPEPMRDEALEEIWAARRRVWEEAGSTWEGYMERLRKIDDEFVRAGGTLITTPFRRPLEPDDTAIIREEPPE